MRSDSEVIAMMAKKGAALGSCGKMCNECAFKLGSAANVEDHNAAAAIDALSNEGAVFNCHPQGGYGNAGKTCVGFLYASQFLNQYR